MRYNNQYVRDLAWVALSPNTITSELCFYEQENSPQAELLMQLLSSLDSKPDKLISHLSKQTRHNLGSYFESLVEFWLLHRNDTEILARNYQLIEDKLTLGECDFLIKIDSIPTHLEVAIKFYMGIGESGSEESWVGRQLRDRLDIKLDKLFNHQLCLSNSELFKIRFPALPFRKALLFKGYFFANYFGDREILPNIANRNIEKSYCCKLSEIDALPAEFEYWEILRKPHWLTYSGNWFHRKELQKQLQAEFATNGNMAVLLNSCADIQHPQPTKFFIQQG